VDPHPVFHPTPPKRICSTLRPGRRARASPRTRSCQLPGVRADVRGPWCRRRPRRVDLANVRFRAAANGHGAGVGASAGRAMVIDPLSSIPGSRRPPDVPSFRDCVIVFAADLADARLHVRGGRSARNLESAEHLALHPISDRAIASSRSSPVPRWRATTSSSRSLGSSASWCGPARAAGSSFSPDIAETTTTTSFPCSFGPHTLLATFRIFSMVRPRYRRTSGQ